MLVIAAAAAAVVTSQGGVLLERARFDAGLRDLSTALRQARQQALAQGRAVAVHWDVATGGVRVEGQPPLVLPAAMAVERARAAAGEWDRREEPAIVFYPDGTAEGGGLIVRRLPDGQPQYLRPNWALGTIELRPMTAADGA